MILPPENATMRAAERFLCFFLTERGPLFLRFGSG